MEDFWCKQTVESLYEYFFHVGGRFIFSSADSSFSSHENDLPLVGFSSLGGGGSIPHDATGKFFKSC